MIYRFLAVLTVVLLAGCGASNPMKVSVVQELQRPSAEQAQVAFMRSSFVGSAISATLYEVTGGELKFVGILNNATQLPYVTTPGKHTFMVIGESADFMEADLAAGKNYYSVVTPRMGAWTARFSVWPIKNQTNADYYLGSTKVQEWINNTKIVENSEQSLAWFQSNKQKIKKKYEKYWPVWADKAQSEIDRRTLSSTDGM